MQAARIYPIAVFVRPRDTDFIMSVNRKMTEEQARKSWERACRLENEFFEYFTAIVEGDNIDSIYEKVKQIILDNSSKNIWVPSNENFWISHNSIFKIELSNYALLTFLYNLTKFEYTTYKKIEKITYEK